MSDLSAHTLEAERAVLGAVLAAPERLDDVLDVLVPSDFFREAHRALYGALLELAGAGRTIDLVLVLEHLRRAGTLEAVGGARYLSELMDGVPRSTNVAAYAGHVRDAADIRRLEAAGTKITALARTVCEDDAKTRIDQAERIVFDLSQRRGRSDFLDGAELARRGYAVVEKLLDTKRHVTGVPSGYPDFDALTRGLQPGTLTLIAARPSMGKTSFALNLAYHAAIEGHHTAFFSLEMGWEELFIRLVASTAQMDSQRLQGGFVNQAEFASLSDAIGAIAESAIHVDDNPHVGLMDVRGKARRLKAKHGLGLVVVDYLQLMAVPKAESRNVAVADVSRGLKLVARELGVPIVVLSQLSRDSEKRGGEKKPQLSDLRDSGALEQDADLVVFIHRPEVYDPKPEHAGVAELIIGKQRNGPTGTVKLAWIREQTRFASWSGR